MFGLIEVSLRVSILLDDDVVVMFSFISLDSGVIVDGFSIKNVVGNDDFVVDEKLAVEVDGVLICSHMVGFFSKYPISWNLTPSW